MTNSKFLENLIAGSSAKMQEVRQHISLAAPYPVNVLAIGPTGSGKELIAKGIHKLSARTGKFIAVNAAAIPAELLEAELFGYEKGAFTGADKSRKGKVEEAANGTLFLDEIGDMPADLQTKLLRVLENSVISKVGSNSEIRLDVRIVCATHKNLTEMVAGNRFREDLLFRLNVFPIDVPKLSERHEDIPEIIEHFIERKSSKTGSGSRPIFDEKALSVLQNYDWPGNVRELHNVIQRAKILCLNGEILPSDLIFDSKETGQATNTAEVLAAKFQNTATDEVAL